MFPLFLPLVSFAGPSCKEGNYNKERFQAIQTRNVNGYRFDITKPPVYAQNSKVYDNVDNGEGCTGDSFILVTNENEKVVFFKRLYLPLRFSKLDEYEVKQLVDRVDVAILQHSGGGSCCGYLHIFQIKPSFKYIGRQEVPL